MHIDNGEQQALMVLGIADKEGALFVKKLQQKKKCIHATLPARDTQ